MRVYSNCNNKPVVANELKRGAGNAVKELRISRGFRTLVFNSNDIDLKDVSGGDNEIRERTKVTRLWGPLRIEVIVGLNGRNAGDEIGARVSEETGSAVVDAGWPLHHLVCGETHGEFGDEKWKCFSVSLNPKLGFRF